MMAVVLVGCVSTVDGRHQAGMPFVKDKVERRYEKKPQELWVASQDVLKYFGTVTGADTNRSVLEANVDTRKVWIKIEEVDAKVSKIVVQARTKGGGTDLDLCGYLVEQIAVRLATGNLAPGTPGRRAY